MSRRPCPRCPVTVETWTPEPATLAALHDLVGAIGTLTVAVELENTQKEGWLAGQAAAARARAARWQDLLEPGRLGTDPRKAIGPESATGWEEDGKTFTGRLSAAAAHDHTLLRLAADPANYGLEIATAVAWVHAKGGEVKADCEGTVTATLP